MDLHGQKRGMAKEKWGLSTSRTEIPLQRHKTVTVTLGQHDTEYYTNDLCAVSAQQSDIRDDLFTEALLKLLPTSARQHADVNNCLHLSPLPYFSRHGVTDGSRGQTIEMTTTKNSLQLTHCEVQLIPLSQSPQPV